MSSITNPSNSVELTGSHQIHQIGFGGGDFVSILISEVYPAKSDKRQTIAEIPEGVGEYIDIFQGSEYYWNGTINDEGIFIINSVKPT